jgi:hypothetical protein
LGERARATVLADLCAVQELARVFLRELRVAPADPALNRLLTAYLTQVVIRALDDGSAFRWAGVWNAWGEVLARFGLEEGQVRLQAKALYDAHGEKLVASFAGPGASIEEQATGSLAATSVVSQL